MRYVCSCRDNRSESDDSTWVTAWAAFTVSFRHLYLWHDSCIEFKFVTYPGTHTRENKLKIYQDYVHYNLRKYLFANRVICISNSLPDSVIEANIVDSFKIGYINTGIILSSNIRLHDPTGPEASFLVIFL